ncbi:MAG: helix-turn-helix transcriptional regulator [Clostridia bacterium]|nr:helix-turn-helix transcriptional regulator [Clostridia bacterium]
MTNFNDTLLNIMGKKKMNARTFAMYVGIKDSTFRDLLRSENIMLRNALKIVDKLGTSLDYFEKKTKTFNCDFKKDYTVDLYKTVKQYLAANKISYTRLCKETKISKANLTRWQQGGDPKYQTIVTLANYFNVSIDKFIGRVD